ncbi:MAG: hypothetical protein ACI4QJ_00855 [Candidatus Spyradenecus sp.]
MKATLAPTPAKMAREMLAADRRAHKRRHRARRAHAVHTAPLIRPETFEPGKHPCHCGASPAQPREAAAAKPSSGGPVAIPSRAPSAHPREAAAAKPQSVGPVARHTCRAQRLYRRLDLLIAAILWGLALACVALTLAIATGIAMHLFGVE